MRAAAEDFRMAQYLGVTRQSRDRPGFRHQRLLARRGLAAVPHAVRLAQPVDGRAACLFAFVAVVIGGMGSLVGAVVGGFLVGFS